MKTSKERMRRALLLDTDSYRPDAKGALDCARDVNLVLTVTSQNSLSPHELMCTWNVTGFILPATAWEATLPPWNHSPAPYVRMDPDPYNSAYPARVMLDFNRSGRLVAEHFLERGFQHLAYCLLGHESPLTTQCAGFQEATESAGREFHCLDWTKRPARYRAWTTAHLRQWMAEQLTKLPKPVGLMLESDWTALEAVEACRERGLLVPEQVAIVGCYNDEGVCNGSPVPISSVDLDRYRLGYESAALLDRLMRGGSTAPEADYHSPEGCCGAAEQRYPGVPTH